MDEATFRRRLAAWRARGEDRPSERLRTETAARARDAREERIAALLAVLDGERLTTGGGTIIRLERPSRPLPLDRSRLARLPGFPDSEPPLVCLDTETTGLETAAGTIVFLVGLGSWQGNSFRQVAFLLPDEADEPALLEVLAGNIPAGARLVTYNGRAFDWPLLLTRYRLRRRRPPEPAGHVDLLPIARRWFRHRMPDARLRSVERFVLGVERIDDIEGWEIPGTYRRFLATGRAAELARVVDHNERDVWSLARLLVLLADRYAEPADLADADAVPVADLAAIARSYRRAGRFTDALACLDAAMRIAGRRSEVAAPREGGQLGGWRLTALASVSERQDRPHEPGALGRLAAERARLLARLDEPEAALAAWSLAARGPGLGAVEAWIEIAKLHEWRRRDPAAALGAVGEAWRLVDRARALGLPTGRLEADLARRGARLRRKLARVQRGAPGPEPSARPSETGPDSGPGPAASGWRRQLPTPAPLPSFLGRAPLGTPASETTTPAPAGARSTL